MADVKSVLEKCRDTRTPVTVDTGSTKITFIPTEIDDEDGTVLGKTEDGRFVEFQFDEITLAK